MTKPEEVIYFVCLIVMVGILGIAVLRGIDQVIENQDQMLCESAKISGNREYLEKCECYYQGENIKCLQKED